MHSLKKIVRRQNYWKGQPTLADIPFQSNRIRFLVKNNFMDLKNKNEAMNLYDIPNDSIPTIIIYEYKISN